MSFQFAHIETYSQKPTASRRTPKQFNSCAQVFGEACRTPIYSQHVEKPQDPIIILKGGAIHPRDLEARHNELLASLKVEAICKNGTTYHRALKSDAKTLYTEIHSHPSTPEEYSRDPQIKADVHKWFNLVFKNFLSRMPSDIAFSTVIHLDESHVHCHILCVNINDPKLDANKLHAGRAAAAKHRSENGSFETVTGLPKPKRRSVPRKPRKPQHCKTTILNERNQETYQKKIAAWKQICASIKHEYEADLENWRQANRAYVKLCRNQRGSQCAEKKAYTNALSRFHDEDYEAVGKPCGLQRIGPRAQRLSTTEMAARKSETKRLENEAAAFILERATVASSKLELKQLHQALVEQAIDLEGKQLILQNYGQELEIATETMRDAMYKFAQPDQDVSNSVLCDYAYEAYNIDCEDRNKLQRMVTDFIDDLVDKSNQSGKSDSGYWNVSHLTAGEIGSNLQLKASEGFGDSNRTRDCW